MKENISFEFIRFDNKMEANIYYRIPKILFESKVFEDLSTDAKYLYSFMLDRVSLSSKNEWIDSDGRIYIIYTVEQVCKILKCGKDKALKLLAELDSKNGIGLIKRVRRGLCKPDKIYVKDIVVRKDHVDKKESAVSENATSGDRFNRLQEGEKTEVMNSEIHITQGSKNRCQEIGKTDTTNNDNIKTYNIKTDKSDQDNSNHHSIKGSVVKVIIKIKNFKFNSCFNRIKIVLCHGLKRGRNFFFCFDWLNINDCGHISLEFLRWWILDHFDCILNIFPIDFNIYFV